MYIYEFITPSDPITFKTDDDKIAFICGLILGNGKAGVERRDENGKEVNIPCMLIFSKEPEKEMRDFIGEDPKEFINKNRKKVSDCFLSFAYGSISSRKEHDFALECITDEEKKKEFLKMHEDKNRTSLNKWVQFAWKLGENYAKEKTEEVQS